MDDARVTELDLSTATGVWVVESSSPTTYIVDATTRGLYRRPGPGSPRGDADDRWAALVAVTRLPEQERWVIRTGHRHRWASTTATGALVWWVQRAATTIRPATGVEVAALPDMPWWVTARRP